MQLEALLFFSLRPASHRAGMEMHAHEERGGEKKIPGDGFLTSTQEDFSGLF